MSSASLNGFECQSLMFTLSSVMINLASDAGSSEDLRLGVQWATWLLTDQETLGTLIPQARYNRATRLAAMFENRGGR
jgi:hypothetical protein